jgi:hypothetical protein
LTRGCGWPGLRHQIILAKQVGESAESNLGA